jgi:hypothetical protein
VKSVNVPITDLNSFIGSVLEISNEFKGQVWWRGQSCYSWSLAPSVARNKNSGGYHYEQNIIKRFIQGAPSRYSTPPPYDDNFAWLFLMQHHGLPTRLLDWTKSPLFACFFAVREKNYANEDGALFALSPYKLNQDQIGEYGVISPGDSRAVDAINSAFNDNVEDVNYIIGIVPPEIHIRIMVQLSVFTLHGNHRSFDKLPRIDNFLYKLLIPKENKDQLKNQLKQIGVTESNLFPDLDHLASDIKELVFDNPLNKEKNLVKFHKSRPTSPHYDINSSTAVDDKHDNT